MKTVKMTPVRSSSIYAVGHDPETNTLHVQFGHSKDKRIPGKTYTYANVTPEEHRALVNAPSVGSHFAQHIKSNPLKVGKPFP